MIQPDDIEISAVRINVLETIGVADNSAPPRSVTRLDIYWRAKDEPAPASDGSWQYFVLKLMFTGDRDSAVEIDSAGHTQEQVLAMFAALVRQGWRENS
jgi:hypothetical protein